MNATRTGAKKSTNPQLNEIQIPLHLLFLASFSSSSAREFPRELTTDQKSHQIWLKRNNLSTTATTQRHEFACLQQNRKYKLQNWKRKESKGHEECIKEELRVCVCASVCASQNQGNDLGWERRRSLDEGGRFWMRNGLLCEHFPSCFFYLLYYFFVEFANIQKKDDLVIHWELIIMMVWQFVSDWPRWAPYPYHGRQYMYCPMGNGISLTALAKSPPQHSWLVQIFDCGNVGMPWCHDAST